MHLRDELGVTQAAQVDVLLDALGLPEIVAGAFVCHVGTPEERIETDRQVEWYQNAEQTAWPLGWRVGSRTHG